MANPTSTSLLEADHKILGSEFCSGYADIFGNWNTGFYCPQSESKAAISCCGTATYKYCCTEPAQSQKEIVENAADHFNWTPLLVGVFCGVALVLLLICITSCYFCSCCLYYKKRRRPSLTNVYQQPSSTSTTTTSALNTHSTSSESYTLPVTNGWIPHVSAENQRYDNPPTNNLSQPRSSNGSTSSNFANSFLPADSLHQNIQFHQNESNLIYIPPTHTTLPRYSQRNQNGPRPNRNSLFTGNGGSVTPRGGNGPNILPQSYVAYTVNSESRPYLISNNFDSPTSNDRDRTQSAISPRNNVASIPSTLPISNSFTLGRRTVHFHEPEANPSFESATFSNSNECATPQIFKNPIPSSEDPFNHVNTGMHLPRDMTIDDRESPTGSHDTADQVTREQQTWSPAPSQTVSSPLYASGDNTAEPHYKLVPFNSRSITPTNFTTSSNLNNSLKKDKNISNTQIFPLIETHRILI